MWAVPILVITAISGWAQRDSRAISPGPRMPISTTTAAWSPWVPNKVRGTPMSLLLLLALACTGPSDPRAERINSLVVVFPADPVTATTAAAKC